MAVISQNLIAGQWSDGEGEIENRNPSDLSDLVGLYAQASSAQLDETLSAARVAQVKWANTGLERRYNVLMAIGNELISRSAELGELLSREEGKPLAEGKGEVHRAGQFFTYYAAEVLRQIGDTADSVRDGVEIGPPRAGRHRGCHIAVELSTSNRELEDCPRTRLRQCSRLEAGEHNPASAVALSEIIARQDIPAGLFSLVMGSGRTIGQKLVESPLVDAISFTGSVPVGKGIATAAIQNLTKVQMEMGSKNALAIMDDGDLDIAVACALSGAFGGSGQKCTASSRLVVHEKIHDAFVDKLVAGVTAMKIGHALEDGVQIGPVVSQEQLDANLAYIDLGKTEGAELLCGGERVKRSTDGYYMSPAVFTGSNNAMRINREEMFAPIASVIKVGSYDEALSTVNDTNFGLTSGIVTRSLARATHFRRNARTGCIMVNLPTAGTDYHVPFGGRGDSSYGPREQGSYAREFYTTVKTAYISAGAPV